MGRAKRRGIALFLVLLVTFVLTMLVGAFFGVNQSSFAALAATSRRKEAMLAADTGLNYVRFQLERDQAWGTNIPGFSQQVGTAFKASAGGGGNTVLGEFPDGRRFEATVENHLAQPASGTFPADSVRVTCTGFSGGFQVKVAVIFKGEPIYDAAASTNGKISVDTKDWEIKSQDPIRNWVRANDDITTPDVLSPPPPLPQQAPRMKFNPGPGSNAQGVLWSRKDIYSGAQLVNDTAKKEEMAGKINGIVAPRSTMNYNLYDLQLTDLKVPDNSSIVNVPPGRYVVTQAAAVPIKNVDHYDGWFGAYSGTTQDDQPPQAIQTLTYYPPVGSPVVYYPTSELLRVRQSAGVRPPAGGTEVGDVVNPGGIPGFSYNFATRKFEFADSKQYKVDGDFTTGYEAPTLPSGVIPLTAVDPDIVFSSGTAGTAPPTFVNVTGNFKVTGTVTGRGALATGGDMNFVADADLSSATTDPLVLYSGNNVNIDATGKSDVRFTGLVYARNEFTVSSTTDIQTVNVTGSLVARNGGIKMARANKVILTYDQSYLKQLTKGLPNGRRRLSQMSWHVL